ncbi:DUF892 family protein [Sphingobacterium sp. SRCM116780]|uniref:YciE/YciF ferroxidase family protein n=1 Tax=Sphingobacterium sp. SRCM116780 TaxID=2907623 RepID=UPI001F3F79C9|nr:DUF892 family protein [Sphingobacterium sp. SRCM116780]UIR54743.1 DUF892 family protein [Sphingobacterium sp. SRCM116780]
MKNDNIPNAHLQELFVDELKDILGAEYQLLHGLKKMSKAAISPALKVAFDTHYQQTADHIERLKTAFSNLGIPMHGRKYQTMEDLLVEADEIIEDFQESLEVLIAALIEAVQKVQHYEGASSGCVVTYAMLLERSGTKKMFGQRLVEERETNELLTEVAMN